MIFRRLSALGACCGIAVGVAVLLGWAFDIELFMTVLPGYIRMKPNTAVGFIAASVAVLLEFSGSSLLLRRVAASFTFAIGAATLFQYFTGLTLHIDQLLFTDPVQKVYPGRMAHLTAINFVLLGTALLCRRRGDPRKIASTVLALFVTSSALIGIVGYLYGVPLLYGSIHYTAMALHTGLGFLLLSLATVFVDRHALVAQVLWSTNTGGVVARRLLPVGVLAPIVLGRIFISPAFNFSELRMGMALQVIASVLMFTGSIALLCHSLNVVSRARVTAEHHLLLDGLTGIYNRRYFDRRLADEMSLSRRHRTPLSLLIFDADHFKRVNDRQGHLAGDEVLRLIAFHTAATLRTFDAVCRYGGEEFGVILPQTTEEGAGVAGERIREAVEREIQAALGFVVTVSVGVTSMCPDDAVPHSMIERADQALYEAKAAGRNCVRVRRHGIQEMRPRESKPQQPLFAVAG